MNRDELVLTASLTRVNHDIGRYIVRILDEDRGGGNTEYTRLIGEVEHTLGIAMIEVGRTLVDRAPGHDYVTVEGTTTEARPITVGPPDGQCEKPEVQGS